MRVKADDAALENNQHRVVRVSCFAAGRGKSDTDPIACILFLDLHCLGPLDIA
jgi:hypothetical protein